jgi:hypothetical protein
MGLGGTPPKPTAFKLAAGNPGKRPLNAREPQPRPGAPHRPPPAGGAAPLRAGFGLTPAARARIQVEADFDYGEPDPIAQFIRMA